MTFSAKYLDYMELQAPIHVYGATQPNVKCKKTTTKNKQNKTKQIKQNQKKKTQKNQKQNKTNKKTDTQPAI